MIYDVYVGNEILKVPFYYRGDYEIKHYANAYHFRHCASALWDLAEGATSTSGITVDLLDTDTTSKSSLSVGTKKKKKTWQMCGKGVVDEFLFHVIQYLETAVLTRYLYGTRPEALAASCAQTGFGIPVLLSILSNNLQLALGNGFPR